MQDVYQRDQETAAADAVVPVAFHQTMTYSDGLLESLPIGVYTCDRDGLVTRYNRRAAELWGREPRAGDTELRFCGAHKLFRVTGEPLPHASTPMADVLRTGIPVRDQSVAIERPDGTRVTVLVNIEPLRDEEGALIGAVNSFQDITTLVRTAEALQESQRDLEDFFENGAVALHLVSGDGIILRANQAELDLLGYSADEYIGRPISEFHADRPAIDDILQRLCQGKNLDEYPAQLRAKDGSIKHVLITSNGRFRNGKLLYTRCFTIDVTERKKADDALRERERQFKEILGALPAAIYTTDAEGRITYFNRAAAEFSGNEPELGSDAWCVSWRLFLPDGTPLPHDECPMAMTLKESRPIRGTEAVAERPDGTRVPFLPFPTPLYDMAGNLIGAVNMLVDISERKEAETRQQRLVDELNHRVKNTLATVQSLASQTFRRAGVPAEVRDSFEARLLALSRAHDQLTNTQWASADFHSLARDIFAPYRGERDRIRLDGPPVKLAPRAALTLAMVLHELATNAAKYGALSAPGGVISMSWQIANGAAPPAMCIAWRETGGPLVSPPERRGFGSRLVEHGVKQELDGRSVMTFHPAGLSCQIEFPLAAGPA